MKEVKYIDSNDLQNFQIDGSGNYIIPKKFKMFIVNDPKTIIAERIVEINLEIEQLEKIEEPSNQELVEIGKALHPYYIDMIRLENLKNELKKLKKLK